MNVVGLDLGRRGIKVYTGLNFLSFPAVVGEWRKLKVASPSDYGEGAYEGVFREDRFFAGVLAEQESEFARQMLIDDKAHPDSLLLALIALHQTGMSEFDVVTGLPVVIHDEVNKQNLINLLQGTHEIEVNGVRKTLSIKRVRVAVEGGAAFWSKPKEGLVRIIDGGSKTINYITMNNQRYVDKDSGTLPFGFDTNKSVNHRQMVTRIAGELGKKWGSQDRVYTVGGEAEVIAKYLRPYFPNTKVLHEEPHIEEGNKFIDLNKFANALGYYNIGSNV